jgi:hypothetical protein
MAIFCTQVSFKDYVMDKVSFRQSILLELGKKKITLFWEVVILVHQNFWLLFLPFSLLIKLVYSYYSEKSYPSI